MMHCRNVLNSDFQDVIHGCCNRIIACIAIVKMKRSSRSFFFVLELTLQLSGSTNMCKQISLSVSGSLHLKALKTGL